jgi:hypothetical protein
MTGRNGGIFVPVSIFKHIMTFEGWVGIGE